MRRRFGDRATCTRCGQDIEWHGRAAGWIDRGANRGCAPYKQNGEIVTPRSDAKHTIAGGLRKP